MAIVISKLDNPFKRGMAVLAIVVLIAHDPTTP